MKYVKLYVPNLNDSVSRIVLDNTMYYIRFTYNMDGDYWTFGIADSQNKTLYSAVKIECDIPLNLPFRSSAMPKGLFFAKNRAGDKIRRNDFELENAVFIYLPIDEVVSNAVQL